MHKSGIIGYYGSSILSFWGTPILISTVVVPIYISTNRVGEFPFLHTLSSMYMILKLCDSLGTLHQHVKYAVQHIH